MGYKKAHWFVRFICFVFGHTYDDWNRLGEGNKCVFCDKEKLYRIK